jgi:hypothetical protein
MWQFTELHCTIVEDIIIFQYSHCICWHSSHTFEQEHVKVEVSFPTPQPVAHSILQCLVIVISSQAFFFPPADQTVNNLLVHGFDSREYSASIIGDGLCCM